MNDGTEEISIEVAMQRLRELVQEVRGVLGVESAGKAKLSFVEGSGTFATKNLVSKNCT